MKKTPILLASAVSLLSIATAAQNASPTTANPSDNPPAPTVIYTPPDVAAAQPAPQVPAPAAPAVAAPSEPKPPAADNSGKTIEIPAGTKVLLALRSGVNTKTAQAGDGVYLSSTFPVVSAGHVVIPSGVYVQGVIDSVVRPGRVKGRAQVTMHFTTLIFPNGSVVSIPGTVDSIPGSDGPTVKKNSEGTIEQAGSKGKDVGTIATTAATGAGLGGIIGAADGHPGQGVGYGAAAGAVGGILYTLFTRGNEVVLPEGQTIEMVFQRPLQLQESNLAGVDSNTTAFVPTGKQPQPLPKPGRSQKILCPLGNLGCQ